MSQELIEQNETEEQSSVSVGSGRMVSMQVIQDVYNEITGKTEKLSKSYRLHHQATFDDIEQLNIKIHQLYEQYHIFEHNCNVTLFHTNDCKEVYSSFERFKAYDRSSLSPVENIRLEYNFLIILPKTKRPQSYTIAVDVHSRAAIKQKAENEHGMPKRIMRIFATKTARLDIEYVDYTVARNFQTTIDNWFSALEQSKSGKLLEITQDYTHNLPVFLRSASILFLCAFFFLQFPSWFPSGLTLESLFKLSVLCFGSVFLLSGIASKIGASIGQAIDNIQPLSYVKLNRGDEKSISDLKRSNNMHKAKSAFGLLVAVGINLLSAWIVGHFGIGM